jgi:hypothetical protein
VNIFEDIFFWSVVAVTVVVFPILGAAVAGNKGRNAKAWFLGCLLFPLSGTLILLLLPSLKQRAANKSDGVAEAQDVHI